MKGPWLTIDTQQPKVVHRCTDEEAERNRADILGHAGILGEVGRHAGTPRHTILADTDLLFIYTWNWTTNVHLPVIYIHESLLKEGDHE